MYDVVGVLRSLANHCDLRWARCGAAGRLCGAGADVMRAACELHDVADREFHAGFGNPDFLADTNEVRVLDAVIISKRLDRRSVLRGNSAECVAADDRVDRLAARHGGRRRVHLGGRHSHSQEGRSREYSGR